MTDKLEGSSKKAEEKQEGGLKESPTLVPTSETYDSVTREAAMGILDEKTDPRNQTIVPTYENLVKVTQEQMLADKARREAAEEDDDDSKNEGEESEREVISLAELKRRALERRED